MVVETSKWKLKLEKYNISKSRYKELCGFCEQYPEWKHNLAELSITPKAIEYSDMPKAHNNVSQTEILAIKREQYSTKCDLIEKTANEVSTEYASWIIKRVCYQVPIDYLIYHDGMPASKRTYYNYQRLFFYLLDKNKK